MGYVFTKEDAELCLEQLTNSVFVSVLQNENQLMMDLLHPMPGECVLDIGCGIGISSEPFVEQGILVTGLDPSGPMLEIAANRLGSRVDFYQGYAEELPFNDNEFDYVSMVKTLEFTNNPEKAIQEACRVARKKLFVGIVNRYSFLRGQLQVQGLFSKTVYNHANFFSPGMVKKDIQRVMGDIPIYYRTVHRILGMEGRVSRWISESGIVRRIPIGAFAGIVAHLVPRFRTMPLELRVNETQTEGTITGLARTRSSSNANSI